MADQNPLDGMTASEFEAKLKLYRLSKDEHGRICELLGRPPRGIEWALFSALWSEHCSYKSSRVHLKGLFNQSPRVLQSFGENAGVVDLGEGERIAFKIESHNHPSFIEPYQGAATGVGGILRDIFTMGARPIALADYLCFGSLEAPRMKGLVDGVVRGIGGYGNCVGVPTVTGQTEFHSSYDGNILVNAMAVGLFRPNEKVFLSKASGPGNWVVYVGAKTGRDGVHGASMASESFEADSASKRPTVQIGDPFFEKLLIESCLEAMAEGLVVAIQDMGAAGLTSSSFEMAAKGGVGFDLRLDEAPLRDPTMQPEEILLSESQERMLLICEPAKFERLQAVFHRWGLDACRIGEVTERKAVRLYWRGELLTEIDPALLTDNAPMYARPYREWQPENFADSDGELHAQALPSGRDAREALRGALRSPQGGSREFVYKQYDSRVGAKTARDCADSVGAIRLPDSGRGLGVALGCRPHVMRFDAKIGGFDAVAFPALELACKGFEPLAVTDCLNFGNPEKERTMTEFVASLAGMNAACAALAAPIISGNVSFYNETMGKNVTPTPSTGLIGLRPSVETIPRSEFVGEGESVFLLRLPQIWCGGAMQELFSGGRPCRGRGEPNPGELATFVSALATIASGDRITASRAVGKFGLAYALARMCLRLSSASEAAPVGAEIELQGMHGARPNSDFSRGWEALFEERLYEVLVTVNADHEGWLRTEVARLAPSVECHRLGQTGGDRLSIEGAFEYPASEIAADYKSVRFVD